jgi:endoribonuclease Dicer
LNLQIFRYCAKLPSDTFTKLTPEWKINTIEVENSKMYICSLRLPINSPLKYPISSYPMPNKALAKRMAALQLCIRLHKENEIDDNLLPVGKENFKANPEDTQVPALPDDEKMNFMEARPGTTKRRQYYYKKIADALTDCKPEVEKSCYLYHIHMVLSCPLPEEQNTRGRKIYPPEDSDIGFGILTHKKIPKVCPFPIYTRSGEVCVNLKLSKKNLILDKSQINKVVSFLNYTFTNVLRYIYFKI